MPYGELTSRFVADKAFVEKGRKGNRGGVMGNMGFTLCDEFDAAAFMPQTILAGESRHLISTGFFDLVDEFKAASGSPSARLRAADRLCGSDVFKKLSEGAVDGIVKAFVEAVRGGADRGAATEQALTRIETALVRLGMDEPSARLAVRGTDGKGGGRESLGVEGGVDVSIESGIGDFFGKIYEGRADQSVIEAMTDKMAGRLSRSHALNVLDRVSRSKRLAALRGAVDPLASSVSTDSEFQVALGGQVIKGSQAEDAMNTSRQALDKKISEVSHELAKTFDGLSATELGFVVKMEAFRRGDTAEVSKYRLAQKLVLALALRDYSGDNGALFKELTGSLPEGEGMALAQSLATEFHVIMNDTDAALFIMIQEGSVDVKKGFAGQMSRWLAQRTGWLTGEESVPESLPQPFRDVIEMVRKGMNGDVEGNPAAVEGRIRDLLQGHPDLTGTLLLDKTIDGLGKTYREKLANIQERVKAEYARNGKEVPAGMEKALDAIARNWILDGHDDAVGRREKMKTAVGKTLADGGTFLSQARAGIESDVGNEDLCDLVVNGLESVRMWREGVDYFLSKADIRDGSEQGPNSKILLNSAGVGRELIPEAGKLQTLQLTRDMSILRPLSGEATKAGPTEALKDAKGLLAMTGTMTTAVRTGIATSFGQEGTDYLLEARQGTPVPADWTPSRDIYGNVSYRLQAAGSEIDVTYAGDGKEAYAAFGQKMVDLALDAMDTRTQVMGLFATSRDVAFAERFVSSWMDTHEMVESDYVMVRYDYTYRDKNGESQNGRGSVRVRASERTAILDQIKIDLKAEIVEKGGHITDGDIRMPKPDKDIKLHTHEIRTIDGRDTQEYASDIAATAKFGTHRIVFGSVEQMGRGLDFMQFDVVSLVPGKDGKMELKAGGDFSAQRLRFYIVDPHLMAGTAMAQGAGRVLGNRFPVLKAKIGGIRIILLADAATLNHELDKDTKKGDGKYSIQDLHDILGKATTAVEQSQLQQGGNVVMEGMEHSARSLSSPAWTMDEARTWAGNDVFSARMKATFEKMGLLRNTAGGLVLSTGAQSLILSLDQLQKAYDRGDRRYVQNVIAFLNVAGRTGEAQAISQALTGGNTAAFTTAAWTAIESLAGDTHFSLLLADDLHTFDAVALVGSLFQASDAGIAGREISAAQALVAYQANGMAGLKKAVLAASTVAGHEPTALENDFLATMKQEVKARNKFVAAQKIAQDKTEKIGRDEQKKLERKNVFLQLVSRPGIMWSNVQVALAKRSVRKVMERYDCSRVIPLAGFGVEDAVILGALFSNRLDLQFGNKLDQAMDDLSSGIGISRVRAALRRLSISEISKANLSTPEARLSFVKAAYDAGSKTSPILKKALVGTAVLAAACALVWIGGPAVMGALPALIKLLPATGFIAAKLSALIPALQALGTSSVWFWAAPLISTGTWAFKQWSKSKAAQQAKPEASSKVGKTMGVAGKVFKAGFMFVPIFLSAGPYAVASFLAGLAPILIDGTVKVGKAVVSTKAVQSLVARISSKSPLILTLADAEGRMDRLASIAASSAAGAEMVGHFYANFAAQNAKYQALLNLSPKAVEGITFAAISKLTEAQVEEALRRMTAIKAEGFGDFATREDLLGAKFDLEQFKARAGIQKALKEVPAGGLTAQGVAEIAQRHGVQFQDAAKWINASRPEDPKVSEILKAVSDPNSPMDAEAFTPALNGLTEEQRILVELGLVSSHSQASQRLNQINGFVGSQKDPSEEMQKAVKDSESQVRRLGILSRNESLPLGSWLRAEARRILLEADNVKRAEGERLAAADKAMKVMDHRAVTRDEFQRANEAAENERDRKLSEGSAYKTIDRRASTLETRTEPATSHVRDWRGVEGGRPSETPVLIDASGRPVTSAEQAETKIFLPQSSSRRTDEETAYARRILEEISKAEFVAPAEENEKKTESHPFVNYFERLADGTSTDESRREVLGFVNNPKVSADRSLLRYWMLNPGSGDTLSEVSFDFINRFLRADGNNTPVDLAELETSHSGADWRGISAAALGALMNLTEREEAETADVVPLHREGGRRPLIGLRRGSSSVEEERAAASDLSHKGGKKNRPGFKGGKGSPDIGFGIASTEAPEAAPTAPAVTGSEEPRQSPTKQPERSIGKSGPRKMNLAQWYYWGKDDSIIPTFGKKLRDNRWVMPGFEEAFRTAAFAVARRVPVVGAFFDPLFTGAHVALGLAGGNSIAQLGGWGRIGKLFGKSLILTGINLGTYWLAQKLGLGMVGATFLSWAASSLVHGGLLNMSPGSAEGRVSGETFAADAETAKEVQQTAPATGRWASIKAAWANYTESPDEKARAIDLAMKFYRAKNPSIAGKAGPAASQNETALVARFGSDRRGGAAAIISSFRWSLAMSASVSPNGDSAQVAQSMLGGNTLDAVTGSDRVAVSDRSVQDRSVIHTHRDGEPLDVGDVMANMLRNETAFRTLKLSWLLPSRFSAPYVDAMTTPNGTLVAFRVLADQNRVETWTFGPEGGKPVYDDGKSLTDYLWEGERSGQALSMEGMDVPVSAYFVKVALGVESLNELARMMGMSTKELVATMWRADAKIVKAVKTAQPLALTDPAAYRSLVAGNAVAYFLNEASLQGDSSRLLRQVVNNQASFASFVEDLGGTPGAGLDITAEQLGSELRALRDGDRNALRRANLLGENDSYNDTEWAGLVEGIVALGNNGVSMPADGSQKYMQALVNGLLHQGTAGNRGLFVEAAETLFGRKALESVPEVSVHTYKTDGEYQSAVRGATARRVVGGTEVSVIYPDKNGNYQIHIRPDAAASLAKNIEAALHEVSHAVLFAQAQNRGKPRLNGEFSELLVDRFLAEAMKDNYALLAVAADYETLTAMEKMEGTSGLGLWLGRSLLVGLVAKAKSLSGSSAVEKQAVLGKIFSLDFKPAVGPVLTSLAAVLVGKPLSETKLTQPLVLIVDEAAMIKATPEELKQLNGLLSDAEKRTELYIAMEKGNKAGFATLLDALKLGGDVRGAIRPSYVVTAKNGKTPRTMNLDLTSLRLSKGAIVRVIAGTDVKVLGIDPDFILRIVGSLMNAVNVALKAAQAIRQAA